ncbi:MAG TPA: sulfur carrier protein ThiS [Pyrinomonadaceae bacterium]|nr:sulfur carrier protein ThiS [Pyrinomonadaceae bacterium]
MRITLNGEAKEIEEGTTLVALVEQLKLAPERLAIEHNFNVVRRDEWPNVELSEGDRVEIVHFVGGG